MRLPLLALAAATAALAANPALAAGRHAAAGMIKPPAQPLPYAQLDAYLKASPKQRASKDWWSESAPMGAAADTSATTPAMPNDTPAATDMPTAATPEAAPSNPH